MTKIRDKKGKFVKSSALVDISAFSAITKDNTGSSLIYIGHTDDDVTITRMVGEEKQTLELKFEELKHLRKAIKSFSKTYKSDKKEAKKSKI